MAAHIIVVGTVFVDCKGFSAVRYDPHGRNVGSVKFVHGGVGRNVAENIGRLGLPTSLVSSVDKGSIGNDVVERLTASGVGASYLARTDTGGMGMWLAVMDENGELAGSISQMPDLQGMENSLSLMGETMMEQATHVALELDLNERITRQVLKLAKKKAKPVYGLPGNLEVVMKAPDVLDGLALFVCNHIELGRLCGEEFGDTDADKILAKLPEVTGNFGLQALVVTLGARGSVYYDMASGERGFQSALPVKVVDTCGAGDAFFSGALAGLARGETLATAVVTGTAVAACTIQSPENNCVQLAEQLAQFRSK